MKATRSYHPHAEGTEHWLEVELEGVSYKIAHVVSHQAYANLDKSFVTGFIDSYLWTTMMRTIEHNLRKNLTHA